MIFAPAKFFKSVSLVSAVVGALTASRTLAASVNPSLFTANETQMRVGSYDSVTGTTNNASLVSGFRTEGVAANNGTLFVANYNSGIVGSYSETTGVASSASLITGLNNPLALAVSGNNLYVGNFSTGVIGEYNATTGAAINSSLVTGVNRPYSLTVLGNNLYIADAGNNRVGEYDATSGAAINASFIPNIEYVTGLALSGNLLYVNSPNIGIGVYDAITGTAINSKLVSYGSNAGFYPIAVAHGDLFAGQGGSGAIIEYDATTGAQLASPFATTGGGLIGMTFDNASISLPEPVSAGMISLGCFCLLARRRRSATAGG